MADIATQRRSRRASAAPKKQPVSKKSFLRFWPLLFLIIPILLFSRKTYPPNNENNPLHKRQEQSQKSDFQILNEVEKNPALLFQKEISDRVRAISKKTLSEYQGQALGLREKHKKLQNKAIWFVHYPEIMGSRTRWVTSPLMTYAKANKLYNKKKSGGTRRSKSSLRRAPLFRIIEDDGTIEFPYKIIAINLTEKQANKKVEGLEAGQKRNRSKKNKSISRGYPRYDIQPQHPELIVK